MTFNDRADDTASQTLLTGAEANAEIEENAGELTLLALAGEPEPFDYGALSVEARLVVQQAAVEIRDRLRRSIQEMIEIGERLQRVKKTLGHGAWGKWLATEFHWSRSLADKLIQLAQRQEIFVPVTKNLDQFAVGAVYLLTSASVPDAAIQEAVSRVNDGQRMTKALAQQIIDRHRERPPERPAPSPVYQRPTQPVAPPRPRPATAGDFERDRAIAARVRELLAQAGGEDVEVEQAKALLAQARTELEPVYDAVTRAQLSAYLRNAEQWLEARKHAPDGQPQTHPIPVDLQNEGWSCHADQEQIGYWYCEREDLPAISRTRLFAKPEQAVDEAYEHQQRLSILDAKGWTLHHREQQPCLLATHDRYGSTGWQMFFRELFDAVQQCQRGGAAPASTVGPVTDDDHAAAIEQLIEQARRAATRAERQEALARGFGRLQYIRDRDRRAALRAELDAIQRTRWGGDATTVISPERNHAPDEPETAQVAQAAPQVDEPAATPLKPVESPWARWERVDKALEALAAHTEQCDAPKVVATALAIAQSAAGQDHLALLVPVADRGLIVGQLRAAAATLHADGCASVAEMLEAVIARVGQR